MRLGDVWRQPRPSYRAGERASAVFVAGDPNADLRRGESYLEVQRAEPDGGWRSVADDGDWDTRFRWTRGQRVATSPVPTATDQTAPDPTARVSTATVTWDIPAGTSGTFRIRYLGGSAGTGTSDPFEVR